MKYSWQLKKISPEVSNNKNIEGKLKTVHYRNKGKPVQQLDVHHCNLMMLEEKEIVTIIIRNGSQSFIACYCHNQWIEYNPIDSGELFLKTSKNIC